MIVHCKSSISKIKIIYKPVKKIPSCATECNLPDIMHCTQISGEYRHEPITYFGQYRAYRNILKVGSHSKPIFMEKKPLLIRSLGSATENLKFKILRFQPYYLFISIEAFGCLFRISDRTYMGFVTEYRILERKKINIGSPLLIVIYSTVYNTNTMCKSILWVVCTAQEIKHRNRKYIAIE